MGRGRPRLKIGEHGKITRYPQPDGRYLARCRVRDTDGEVRYAKAITPAGVVDKYGDKAEAALRAALAVRQPPGAGELTTDTRLGDLLDRHITRIEVESETSGKPSPKTVDTYRYAVKAAKPFLGAVRCVSARPHRGYSPMRWPAYSGRTVTPGQDRCGACSRPC